MSMSMSRVSWMMFFLLVLATVLYIALLCKPLTNELETFVPMSEDGINEKLIARNEYLMSIDSDFRTNISHSVPIHCYSGEYGLFPKKYRKFIDLLIEYSRFHSHQPTTKVLFWQCSRRGICGGLGDRMRGVPLSLVLHV